MEQPFGVDDTANDVSDDISEEFPPPPTQEPGIMKAAVIQHFGGPNVFIVKNISIPSFGPYQMLVKVKAAGINPVDMYTRSGRNVFLPTLPAVLGKEISGVVEDFHETVTTFKKGDQVYCGVEIGGYAQYAVANESKCYPLSIKLNYEQGASLFFTYFTVHRALFTKGHIMQNHTIFIHGASGTLGVAAVQLAKYVGATVVASVKSFELEGLILEAGADHVVYHDTDSYLYEALKKANKTGFDIVLEVLGHRHVQIVREYLAPRGRIVVVGFGMKHRPFGLRGIVYCVSFFKYTEAERDAAAQFVNEASDAGAVKPVIGYTYRLDEAPRAHKDLEHYRASKGKPVFVM